MKNEELVVRMRKIVEDLSEDELNFLYKCGGKLVKKHKKGNLIKIKPENKGKFTDYCGGKVTSKCITKGKNSSDPKIVKRATFAANAIKWNH